MIVAHYRTDAADVKLAVGGGRRREGLRERGEKCLAQRRKGAERRPLGMPPSPSCIGTGLAALTRSAGILAFWP